MLTMIDNLRETMKKDGHPDRFVNQFEFINLLLPTSYYHPGLLKPGEVARDGFGVYWSFPEGQPGPLPIHDEEHTRIRDITEWDQILTDFPAPPEDPGFWGMVNGWAARTAPGQYTTALVGQGILERLFSLLGMEEAFASFYEEPESAHALIDFLTEAELYFAKNIMDRVPSVNAILHHDDWGFDQNSFFAREMFDEFITPAYRKIYSYWRSRGVELIIHHSDSYAVNLVPSMIEVGIDIWQGCVPSNNIPELMEEYAGSITFMGEIETRRLDVPNWTKEEIAEEVARACKKCKGPSFIPCLTAGMPLSSIPGVYDTVSGEIDRMSRELF